MCELGWHSFLMDPIIFNSVGVPNGGAATANAAALWNLVGTGSNTTVVKGIYLF